MNLPTIWDVYFGSCCTFPSNIKETRIYFLYDSNMIWLTAMAGVVIAWAREEHWMWRQHTVAGKDNQLQVLAEL